MEYKSEEAFAAAIKGTKPQGLYLLYGGENYLIETWAKKLAKSFGAERSAFNLQKLDGRKLDCDALYVAVETLPLMAEEKCVLVDNLDFKSMPPSEIDKLMEIISDLPPETTLILTAKNGSFDAKSAAGKKLVKRCGEAGAAVLLGARSPQGVVRFLRAGAEKRGCTLSPDLARYIFDTCETDMNALENELAKICAYAGAGEISKFHVDAVATVRTEARVFDLGKAILAGNAQRALELLRDLFYLREAPVAILSALSLPYIDLYRARVAKDGGKTPVEAVEAFGYRGREFRINNAWNARFSASVLRASLEALVDCDRRLKSTSVDGRVLLEEAVVRLLALRGRG